MTTIEVWPNFGMLYPAPSTIALAGRPCRLAEFRVKDVGRLENLASRHLEHPHKGLEESLDFIRSNPRGTPGRAEHIAAIDYAEERWPPAMGDPAFEEFLGTDEGAFAFLSVLLDRENPGLPALEVARIASEMTEGEWEVCHRVAWGVQPWDRPGATTEGDGVGMPSVRATEALGMLIDKGKIGPGDLIAFAEMPISLFAFYMGRGSKREVRLPAWPFGSKEQSSR